uniref:Uncharacterized protein n=1 Tax=Anguilla anguilla TaxID=7936 RepID=A0A0E9Y0L9_ANGAN
MAILSVISKTLS